MVAGQILGAQSSRTPAPRLVCRRGKNLLVPSQYVSLPVEWNE